MKSRSFLERTPFVQRGAQSLIDFFLFRAAKASGIKEFPNFLSCTTSVALVIAKLESPAYLDFSMPPHKDVFTKIRSTVTGLQMWEDGSNQKNQLIDERVSTFLYLLAEGGSRQRLSLSVRYIFVFDADQ